MYLANVLNAYAMSYRPKVSTQFILPSTDQYFVTPRASSKGVSSNSA